MDVLVVMHVRPPRDAVPLDGAGPCVSPMCRMCCPGTVLTRLTVCLRVVVCAFVLAFGLSERWCRCFSRVWVSSRYEYTFILYVCMGPLGMGLLAAGLQLSCLPA